MKIVTRNRWDGGVQDPRDAIANGYSSVRHFLLSKTKLSPYRNMVTESLDTGTLANQRMTDAIRYTPTSGTTQIYGLGQVSTSSACPKFYHKSTVNSPSSSFQAIANGEDTTGVVIPGSLIGYKGDLYCLKSKSGSTYLVKHVVATSTAEVGVIGTSPSNGVVPQMFIHPKDNKLYIVSGNVAKSYDGSALSSAVTFSDAHSITSQCPYGNNILLGMVSKDTTGSVVGVWSGSTTSAELVDVVNWGSDTLLVLENIGDIVVGVSGLSVGGASDVGVQNTVTVRVYTGGTPQTIQGLESVGTLGSRVYPLKAKKNDAVYFPMAVYLNGTRVHQIWTIYKNSLGQLVVAPDRKCNNNTELATETIIGLSIIGDYMWTAFSVISTTGSFFRTNDGETYTTTSSFETIVNPGIDPSDRNLLKKLKAISLRCGSPSGSSNTVTLSYAVDGGSFRTIYTGTSTSKVRVIEEVAEQSEAFLEGREYIFKVETTGPVEIYELKYGYEIQPTQFKL
jgi:hypothetical protein